MKIACSEKETILYTLWFTEMLARFVCEPITHPLGRLANKPDLEELYSRFLTRRERTVSFLPTTTIPSPTRSSFNLMGAMLSVNSYESFTLVAIAFILANAAVKLGIEGLRTFARLYGRGPSPETVAMGRLESGQDDMNA